MRLVANVRVLFGFDPKNNQTHGLVKFNVPPCPTHPSWRFWTSPSNGCWVQAASPGKPWTPEVEASRQVFWGWEAQVLETRWNKQTLQGNQYSWNHIKPPSWCVIPLNIPAAINLPHGWEQCSARLDAQDEWWESCWILTVNPTIFPMTSSFDMVRQPNKPAAIPFCPATSPSTMWCQLSLLACNPHCPLSKRYLCHYL